MADAGACPSFGPQVLEIDSPAEAARIAQWMVRMLGRELHRRGVVVALSGGVDSSVCAALAVQALGPQRVFGLLLPEHESSPESAGRGARIATQLGIEYTTMPIGDALAAAGCYSLRDAAIRRVFPAFADGWKSKIAIRGGATSGLNYFTLVVEAPSGAVSEQRLPLDDYLQIVAATNFKQRFRKAMEYYHADRLNFAVIGTPNRLEFDQGFFVKNGDGSADLKPIAHLYKTQVYVLARHFGLPEDVCTAAPTTDTYTMPQGQDEFFFALPYAAMDLSLWAYDHGVPASELALSLRVPAERAELVYRDIEAKRRAARYLHKSALLVERVGDIAA